MCYRVCSIGTAPYTIQNVDIVKVSETSMFNVAFLLSRDASVSLTEEASPCLLHPRGAHHDAIFTFVLSFHKTPSLLKVVKRSRDISSINNSALPTRPQPSCLLPPSARRTANGPFITRAFALTSPRTPALQQPAWPFFPPF